MPGSRLIDMFVKNVAAVESPANRRRFLVIKAAKEDVTKGAIKFSEALLGKRMYALYCSLEEHYGALMNTMSSIQYSDEAEKSASIKAALGEYVKSLEKAVPKMVRDLLGDEAGMEETKKSLRGLQPQMSALVKSQGLNAAASTAFGELQEQLTALITEVEDMSKTAENPTKPDAGMLKGLAASMAATFGRLLGADAEVVDALEKSAKGEDKPADPMMIKVLEALEKSNKTNTEISERLVKSEQTINALQQELALQKHAKDTAEFADLGLNPADAKDVAVMQGIKAMPKEAGERMIEVMKSAQAKMQTAGLFVEKGSKGNGTVAKSAVERVEEACGAILSKAENSKMNKAEAMDQVFSGDRNLYEAWRLETTVGVQN